MYMAQGERERGRREYLPQVFIRGVIDIAVESTSTFYCSLYFESHSQPQFSSKEDALVGHFPAWSRWSRTCYSRGREGGREGKETVRGKGRGREGREGKETVRGKGRGGEGREGEKKGRERGEKGRWG